MNRDNFYNRTEALLIKSAVILMIAMVVAQYILSFPGLSRMIVRLDRLEGTLWQCGQWD